MAEDAYRSGEIELDVVLALIFLALHEVLCSDSSLELDAEAVECPHAYQIPLLLIVFS